MPMADKSRNMIIIGVIFLLFGILEVSSAGANVAESIFLLSIGAFFGLEILNKKRWIKVVQYILGGIALVAFVEWFRNWYS